METTAPRPAKGTAPRHHPTPELLLDYATGAAAEGEALVIAAHLAFCPACCGAAGDIEAIGGALLDALEPARLPPNLLNRALAAIDGDIEKPAPTRRKAIGLPDLVRRFMGDDESLPPWRQQFGGIQTRTLPVRDSGGQLTLLKVKPGSAIFRHTHKGVEWTQVLQGGLSDCTGQYGAGDFICLDESHDHKPTAAPGEDCICLTLLKGELQFTGLMGWLARPFIRI